MLLNSATIVDGSRLEGGGQIVRVTLACSSILKLPVEIIRIRAGRSKPGLAAQHLEGCRLVNRIADGKLSDDHIGSTQIQFTPNPVSPFRLRYEADCGTAGSITLLSQISLPCIILQSSKDISAMAHANQPTSLQLKGGTNVSTSPPIDHTMHVLLPLLNQFGVDCNMRIAQRGYYPKGGGTVIIDIFHKNSLHQINLTKQGSLNSINACVYGNGPKENISYFEQRLQEYFYSSPLVCADFSSSSAIKITSIDRVEISGGLKRSRDVRNEVDRESTRTERGASARGVEEKSKSEIETELQPQTYDAVVSNTIHNCESSCSTVIKRSTDSVRDSHDEISSNVGKAVGNSNSGRGGVKREAETHHNNSRAETHHSNSRAGGGGRGRRGGGRFVESLGAQLWATTSTGCILQSNIMLQGATGRYE